MMEAPDHTSRSVELVPSLELLVGGNPVRLRLLPGVSGLLLGAVCGSIVGCSGRELRECERLLEDESFEAAARRCGELYASTGDPRFGAVAAEAQLAQGDHDGVLEWAARLEGTSVEARLQNTVASSLSKSGDDEGSLDASRRCATLHRKTSEWADAARCAYRGFYAAWSLSRYGAAFELALQSFEDASRAGDPRLEARALGGLFTAFYEVGDLASARRALEAWDELTPDDQRWARADILINRGLLRLNEDRPQLALEAFETAGELGEGQTEKFFWRALHLNFANTLLVLNDVEEAARHVEEAARHVDGEQPTSLFFYRGSVHLQRGEPERALAHFDEALARDPFPDWAWNLHELRGQALERRGDLRAAEEAYEAAATIVEDMRRQLGVDELQHWHLARKREPLEALVRIRAGADRAVEALASVERAMSRTFLDAFIRSMGSTESGAVGAAGWGDRMTGRLEALEVFLPALRESPVAALRPVRDMLRELEDEHVLIYFEAGETLWLFTLKGGTVEARELEPSPPEVRRGVERLLADPDDRALAERLGPLLLPEGVRPARGVPVRIVADGTLARLPFAALRHGGRALIEDHDISYAPSLNALTAFRERRRTRHDAPRILADPGGDLPGAAREAEMASAHLGVVPNTGRRATVSEFRAASGARVLHLATHTGLGAGGPWLALADGRLGADEILRGTRAGGLVVLAGCASAAPEGYGMWGSMGAAFLSAGSESVLGTLWSVDDRSTLRALSRFYEEGGAMDPIGGLARAQRALILETQPPSVWAPFVVFGSSSRIRRLEE
jgi:tetratricopeptide (TPR) repeat protein